jgi:hypothetical protein
MKLRRGLLIIAALAIGCLPVHSQSRKEIYELQERCGKTAAEMFDRDFPKDDRKGLEVFENNYNASLNKCFLLEENTMITRDQGKTYTSKLLTLIDVNGNKVYGSFSFLQTSAMQV